jgi:hypothetical protein
VLKADVLAGVAAAKVAVQDLATSMQLVRRGEAVHVPGSAPTYPEAVHNVMVVLTSFKTSEVDGDRIRASDQFGIIFPETGKPIPEPNDFVRNSVVSYRVLHNNKVMAGDTVALSQVHLRLS